MRQTKNNRASYSSDFYKWAMTQATLLKKGDFEHVDLKHIIEEIEDLGKSERSALESQLIRLMMHMLKIRYQSQKHTKSWDKSIGNARLEVEKIIRKNPSLKRELNDIKNEAYYFARKKAHIETGLELKIFPEACPWSLKEVLGD
jgi:hypothetical protein